MYEIMCFDEHGNSINKFGQWDTNRVMYIDWEHSCTPIFQFGNTKSDRLLVVKGRIIEDETKKIAEVNVPNILLQQAYPIIGFVYLENEVDGNEHYYTGKTVYNFKIPVRAKAKPEDYKYTENTEYISWINLESEARAYLKEVSLFRDEYENTLGTAKENADKAIQAAEESKTSEDNANESENKARDSEEAAHASKVAAKASQDAAKLSENNAHDSEVAAKESEEATKSSEQKAKASEVAAKTSEGNAKVSEVNAKESEENAARSETKAKESEVNAKKSEDNARVSEANAKISETNSKNSEIASKASEDASKASEVASALSEQKSKASEEASALSEQKAKASELASKASELAAKASEEAAKDSENRAKDSESNARASEDAAKASEESSANFLSGARAAVNEAAESAVFSEDSARLSKSYAVGETNTRTDEDVDNAKYYYYQTKFINESLGGVFSPKGTIKFSELQSVAKGVGYVYHVSDNFVTDDTFRCGAGVSYYAGTNVYYTSDGYWDCFGGKFVTDETFNELMQTIADLRERVDELENQNVLEVVE